MTVEFQNGPDAALFNRPNFMPGDTQSGWVKAANNGTQDKQVATWAKNVSDDGLSAALDLTIKRGDSIVYQSRLSEFFAADHAGLAILPPQESAMFDYILSFDPSAGNEYQQKSVSFDLYVGTYGDNRDDGGDNDDGDEENHTSGAYVGSEGQFIFQISNVRSEKVSQTAAVILWDTNFPGTSMVIYGPEDGKHNLEPGNPDNKGYDESEPEHEDKTLVKEHGVKLTGLKPCFVYYYRVVSRRDTDISGHSVSAEKQFQTLCGGKFTEPAGGRNVGGITPQVASDYDENPEPAFEEEQSDDSAGTQGPEGNDDEALASESSLLADLMAAGSYSLGVCWPDFPWWLFILIAVYPLLIGWSNKNRIRRESDPRIKNYLKESGDNWMLSAVVPAGIGIWGYLTRHFCLPWWWLILIALLYVIGWKIDKNNLKKLAAARTGSAHLDPMPDDSPDGPAGGQILA